MSSNSEPTIFSEPNKYARPPRLDLYEHKAVFHGYQEFVLTKDSVRVLPEDTSLQRKQRLLTQYFRSRYLKKRTVLDLGSNAGFFTFWAIQNGADKVIALDMDDKYLQMIGKAKAALGPYNIEAVKAKIMEWNQPCDVVLAFALIHWIYSCTALFGSLDSAVEKLAQLTNHILLVEWIDPEDPAIGFFHHIDWNKEFVHEPYNLQLFEAALGHHFARYEVVGRVSATRKLYVAFRTMHEIEHSCPLPLTRPIESVISSRFLAEKDGTEYWSRVYDGGNVIYKQATLDLAEREANFLSHLTSDYFPRILDVKLGSGYSVIVLKKIQGSPLNKSASDINASQDGLNRFFQHCLCLLRELKEIGITHRDIRPDNILIRDNKPVLIDFGWAISDTQTYFTPPLLGDVGRPPDGEFCDIYSMGKVFKQVNEHRYQEYELVIELMTESDPSIRIKDLETLKTLFGLVSTSPTEDANIKRGGKVGNGDLEELGKDMEVYRLAILQLLEQISKRNLRLRQNEYDAWTSQLKPAIDEIKDQIPAGDNFILVDDDQWGTGGKVAGRQATPFLEREGEYWGPPPDDETAFREFERLRHSGANFIVFAWPSFWWLDYYTDFHRYLRSQFRCSLENERLIVFDLRQ